MGKENSLGRTDPSAVSPESETTSDQRESPLSREKVIWLLKISQQEGWTNLVSRKDDPSGLQTLKQWGNREDFSQVEVAEFLQPRLTDKSKELLRQTAKVTDLDLEKPDGFFEALGIMTSRVTPKPVGFKSVEPIGQSSIKETGGSTRILKGSRVKDQIDKLREGLQKLIPKRSLTPIEATEGEIITPTNSEPPKISTPYGGELLGRLLQTSALLSDPEIRQMTIEAVREWLEAGLSRMRAANDEIKALALGRQLTQTEKLLDQILEGPIPWRQLLQDGLEVYYVKNKVPPKQRFGLQTPQGIEIALKEVYPQLAAAIIAAPEVASELADGMVAREVEEEKNSLDLNIAENKRKLSELQERNRGVLEKLKIGVNRELAKRYADAAPILESQATASRRIKAIVTATWVVVSRETIEEISRIPPAIVGGFLDQVVEEARKKPVTAGSMIVGIGAGIGIPIGLGLSLAAGAPVGAAIFGGTLVSGACMEGILKKPPPKLEETKVEVNRRDEE